MARSLFPRRYATPTCPLNQHEHQLAAVQRGNRQNVYEVLADSQECDELEEYLDSVIVGHLRNLSFHLCNPDGPMKPRLGPSPIHEAQVAPMVVSVRHI